VLVILVFNGIISYSIEFIFQSCFFFFFSNAKDKVHRTIEDELVEAFVKVGAIPQAHADDMSKVYIYHSSINNKKIINYLI